MTSILLKFAYLIFTAEDRRDSVQVKHLINILSSIFETHFTRHNFIKISLSVRSAASAVNLTDSRIFRSLQKFKAFAPRNIGRGR